MSEAEPDDSHPEARVIPMPGVELERYEPPPTPVVRERSAVAASVWDTPIVVPRSAMREWVDDCYWGARLRLRKAVIHVVRVPLYYVRSLEHVPRGLWICLVQWWSWVWDLERRTAMRLALADPNLNQQARVKTFEKLVEARRTQLWLRWVATLVAVAFAPLIARWIWRNHTELAIVCLVALPAALGGLGGRRGQIVQHIDLAPATGIPSVDRIVEAFLKATITKVNADQARVFGSPIRDGEAWSVHVAVPDGSTFGEVVTKREKLASGLGYAADCMELEPLSAQGRPENEFLIHMALIHPAKRPKPRWPLLDQDRHNIFRPFTVGWDLRGRPVAMSLMWVHTLLGAAPRLGKTTLLRQTCLATLKDPRADLIIVDFGGGMDFRPFEPFAKVFIHGETLDKVEEFKALLGSLRKEYQRRQARLRELSVEDVPEGRLTEALAHRRGFRPTTVVVDEFQVATRARGLIGGGKLGEEIVTEWAELEKVCPKVGIQFVKATQAADDSVPTELRNIALQRVALTVATYQASISLLGNEAYNRGLDASKLGGVKGYAIVCATPSDDFEGFQGKVSLANCTVADANAALQRIAVMRTQYAPTDAQPKVGDGDTETDSARIRASNQALADDPEGADHEAPLILADVIAVWPRGTMYCHRDVLAELTGLSQSELTQQLAAAGVEVAAVRMKRTDGGKDVQRGWRLVDVEAARR